MCIIIPQSPLTSSSRHYHRCSHTPVLPRFLLTHFHASGVKGENLQVPRSAISPIIIEMNHLHNNSDVIKAKAEAQAQLATQRAKHLHLKRQLKQMVTRTDALQAQMETLKTEKTNLQSNKTTVGKTDFQTLFGGTHSSAFTMVKTPPPPLPQM